MQACLVSASRPPLLPWRASQRLLNASDRTERISQDKSPPAECLQDLPAACRVFYSKLVHECQRMLEIAHRDLESIQVCRFLPRLNQIRQGAVTTGAVLIVKGQRFHRGEKPFRSACIGCFDGLGRARMQEHAPFPAERLVERTASQWMMKGVAICRLFQQMRAKRHIESIEQLCFGERDQLTQHIKAKFSPDHRRRL